MRQLVITLVALWLVACSTESEPPVENRYREPGAYLTQSEAAYRKSVVVNPAYQVAIELDSEPGKYRGTVITEFEYRGGRAPLTIDFSGGEVLSLELNGKPVDYIYKGNFIALPGEVMAAGPQRLQIDYVQQYSQDGSGLYRYEDPEDGRAYLYTDFQPFDANRMFPHFDQPDLKARFTLEVNAPAQWYVVSTTRESSIDRQGERWHWRFPTTELMSSYIFSLHAGEYVVFEDKDFRYPLRLFVRQSMARYAEPDEWFKLTKQGFDFFDAYFALPYPFKKYDQLIVPDYNAGAMENIAAVTFSEYFLHRGESTRRQRMDLANVIMHEMAHMWFGDITTMAWWNGLWLNESFATYMAELAVNQATEYTENWQEFFMGMKNWAYWEDQLVTTHSIELPVRTTDDAFTNFDGITYGKGAAVLKQLGALLGEEAFRQGVRDYLAANAWGNTELNDFIGALSNASNRDLSTWTDQWLYQAGLNSIETDLRCEAGKIVEMRLLQSAPEEYPTLRSQRTQIAFYGMDGDRLLLADVMPVVFDGATTNVEAAVGKTCPDFVYPNYDDWAYIKVKLDERSIDAARSNMNAFNEPMQRTMVWYDLWSMVEDGTFPLSDYLDVLALNMPREKDLGTASDLLGNLRSGFAYLHQVAASEQYLAHYAGVFEPLLWELVSNSEGDARRTWLRGYIDVANNEAAFARLRELLTGIEGFELDQDQRWQIVMKLNEFTQPHHAALARRELERDPSSIGKENSVRSLVLSARGDEKWMWMERAVAKDEAYTLRRSRTIQRGLFPYSSQRDLAKPFADRMIEQLPELSKRHDVVFHDKITSGLLPRLCTDENVKRLHTAAQDLSTLNPAIVRGLKVAAQMDERCVRVGEVLEAQEAL